MKKFTSFLTEARVGSQNVERALFLFLKYVSKKLNVRFYRHGGPGYTVKNKRGYGVLYFWGNGKAIRFNVDGGEIVSINTWRKFRLGTKADRTIELGGLNVVHLAYRLVDVIKNENMTGGVKVHDLSEATITEDGEFLLSEAKRVSPAEFFNLVKSNLEPGENIKAMRLDRLSQIALDNDVQMPTVVRSAKSHVRGARDVTKILSDDQADSPSAPTDRVYTLKITPRDTKTNKFVSAADDEFAQDMYKKINKMIQEPDNEVVQKEMKHPDTLFGHMSSLVKIVLDDHRNSLVVYGGPGVGKSFVVEKTIKDHGLVKGEDYVKISGRITNAALYQTLYRQRDDKVILFDDCDSMWKDSEAANILKAALDSYDERIISWGSSRTVNVSQMSPEEREQFNATLDKKLREDPEGNHKFPGSFEFTSNIIFISNLKENDFDSAVLDRSMKIDMTLTIKQVFMRLRSIAEHLGDKTVPVSEKLKLIDILEEMTDKGEFDTMTIRAYVGIEGIYKSGAPNWRELLQYN